MIEELRSLFPALVVRETERTDVRQTVEVHGPWGRLEYGQSFGLLQLDWHPFDSASEWLDGAGSVQEVTQAGLEHLEQLLEAAQAKSVALPKSVAAQGERLAADLRVALGVGHGR